MTEWLSKTVVYSKLSQETRDANIYLCGSRWENVYLAPGLLLRGEEKSRVVSVSYDDDDQNTKLRLPSGK